MSKHNAELSEAINKTIWAFNHGQYRYMNEFIQLNKSGSDMLHLGLFPDAKEITESYGAYNAVRTKLKQYDPTDPDVNLVSVGDGTTPRTAALFAFRTKWKCISIDPVIKSIPWEDTIQRLTCIASKIEDIPPSRLEFDKVVIVAVHSHASLPNILKCVKGKVRSLVAIPCCVPYVHESIKPIEWQDSGIWSPKNTVKVWRSI